MSGWTFLSHHAQVLLCISRDPDARLREIAAAVGITERAVQAIVNDLVTEGYVERTRVGRRNHYAINTDGADAAPAAARPRRGHAAAADGLSA